MKIIITSAYFDIGPDVLVVWPIAQDGCLPVFSIDSQIIVQNRGVGLKELSDTPQLKAYYADKFIHFKSEYPGLILNRVSVCDLTGREILSEITNGSHPIPFSWGSCGVYFISVNFNGGETRIY